MKLEAPAHEMSPQKALILLLALVLGGSLLFWIMKNKQQPEPAPQTEERAVLTEQEREKLIQDMTAPSETASSLTEEDREYVAESTSADPDAGMIAEEERNQLLDAMTVQQ